MLLILFLDPSVNRFFEIFESNKTQKQRNQKIDSNLHKIVDIYQPKVTVFDDNHVNHIESETYFAQIDQPAMVEYPRNEAFFDRKRNDDERHGQPIINAVSENAIHILVKNKEQQKYKKSASLDQASDRKINIFQSVRKPSVFVVQNNSQQKIKTSHQRIDVINSFFKININIRCRKDNDRNCSQRNVTGKFVAIEHHHQKRKEDVKEKLGRNTPRRIVDRKVNFLNRNVGL